MNPIATSPHQRHKEITLLFLKYSSLRTALPTESSARSLAGDIQSLGTNFTKAARLLSVRGDLLPAPFLGAFGELKPSKISDESTEPESLDSIHQIVEDELGKKMFRAFASFDSTPIRLSGAGQIHHATLHDGRQVSVRIQRPIIRQRIVKDLDSLTEIAAFIDHPSGREHHNRFSRVIDRLRISLMRELDYRREAAALTELREKLDHYGNIVIPEVIQECTSARILTTEFIDGSEIWEVPSPREAVTAQDLAEQLLGSYLDQMFLIGHVHPEPNLENLLITRDGRIIVTEATGSIKISPSFRTLLHYLLIGISSRDAVSTADAALKIGHHGNREIDLERSEFLGEIRHALQAADISHRVIAVARVASSAGLPFPSEIIHIADLFNHLSTVTTAICTRFDLEQSVQNYLHHQARETEQNTIRFAEPSAA